LLPSLSSSLSPSSPSSLPEATSLTEAVLSLIVATDDQRQACAERALATVAQAAALSDNQRVSLCVLLYVASGDRERATAELTNLRSAGPAVYEPAAELVAAATGDAASSAEARALLLATVAMNLQQSELALRLATDVLRVRPACQWALAMVMQTGDTSSLTRLAELHPELHTDVAGPLGWRLAALTATARRDYTAAAGPLEQALAQTPDDTELQIQLAETLQKIGREDRALELFRQAMETRDSAWAANNAAYLVARLHADDPAKLAQARSWIDHAIERHPAEHALYDTAGWLAFLQGDIDRACRELHRAVKVLPQSPDVHFHLGMAWRQAGQQTLAQWHLQQAVELGQSMTQTGVPVPAETREAIQLATEALAKM
jgi:tetratricopeptide (TPR) repeat protein